MSALYHVAKAAGEALHAAASEASRRLNAIPGIGSGPMGLTPDAIKFSPEYREARAAYERAAKAARDYSGRFCKQYAKEIKAERAARRAAGLL